MKRILIVVVLLLFCVCSIGIWLYWRSDYRRLTVLIENMVELAEKKPSKLPHEGVLKFAGTEKIFTDPLEIYAERPAMSRSLDKEACRSMLMFLHRNVAYLKISTADLQLNISGDHADFSFDTEIKAGFKDGKSSSEIVSVQGRASKISGRWRISALSVGSVLKR